MYGTVTNGGCAGPVSTDASKNHCTRQPQANMLVSAIGTSVNVTGNSMTDSNGNYRLVIAPGTYAVSAHAARANIFATCKGPVSVTVKKGIATKQNFDCDNGEQ
jgi:hypothetical protein